MKNDLERVKSDILVNISEQLDAVTTEMLGRLFCKQYLFLMPSSSGVTQLLSVFVVTAF